MWKLSLGFKRTVHYSVTFVFVCMHAREHVPVCCLCVCIYSHGEVRQLWENMKASQPELLDGFASFLDGISQQLQDAERQKEQLKTDLAR